MLLAKENCTGICWSSGVMRL